MAKSILESMREEMVMRRRIASFLKEGPASIPGIAQALGVPERETTLWVMAMWRYGLLEETGKSDADGYFTYRLKTEGDDGAEN